MPILDKANPEEVRRYNNFVRNSPYTTAIQQDMNWALVKEGWDDKQVYIEKEGIIVAAISLLMRKVLANYALIYAAKGPTCDLYNIDLVNELVGEVDQVARDCNAFMLRFDPEVKYDKKLEDRYIARGYKVRNIGYGKNELIQPRLNMVLGLEGFDEKSLYKSFSRSKKRNIEQAIGSGVKVTYTEPGDKNIDQALEIFYDLYKTTTERNQIGRRPFYYIKNLINAYPEDTRIYIAEHEGDYLSAAIPARYGNKITYAYGASADIKRDLRPNELIQWEMIKWGLETGVKAYDFGAVYELNRNDGLYQFKEGFCRKDGVTEYIGEIDKVYKPAVYYAFTKVVPGLQSFKRKIKKRGN